MNKKPHILYLIIILFSIQCYSQLQVSKVGEEVKLKTLNLKKEVKSNFFLKSSSSLIRSEKLIYDDGYFVFEIGIKNARSLYKEPKGKLIIHQFNKDLEHIKEMPVTFEYEMYPNGKSEILDIIYLNNEIFFFVFQLKKSRNYIYLYRYDANSLKQVGDRQTILESSKVKGLAIVNEDYNISISPDSSHILIYMESGRIKKGLELDYVLLDEKVKPLKKRMLKFERKKKASPKIINGIVDDNGNIVFLKADLKRTSKQKKNFEIVNIQKEDTTEIFSPLSFNMDKGGINDIELKILNDSLIALAGFYGDKHFYYTDGIAYAMKSINNQNWSIGKIPFTKEQIKEKERKRNLKDGHMGGYYIKEFHLSNKKELVVIGERYSLREYEVERPLDGGGKKRKEYNYGNIMITSINLNSNSIKLVEKIQKRDKLESAVEQNFYLHKVNSELSFIYNNHPKNLGEKNEKRVRDAGGFLGKENIVIQTSLTSEGELKNEPCFTNPNDNISRIHPSSFKRISDDEIIFTSISGESFKIIKCKFE